ncbi:hypothetical protein SGPA1_10953 [Streptomyces misionensis JCM 4497]
MFGLGPVEGRLVVGGDDPQPLRDQRVLGLEVPVDRHLGGLGLLGDRLDADPPDPLALEELLRRVEDALTGRQLRHPARPAGGRSHDYSVTSERFACSSALLRYQSVPLDTARYRPRLVSIDLPGERQ